MSDPTRSEIKTWTEARWHTEYLNDLRQSGICNMFGSAPWLADEFDLDIKEARKIVHAWMDSFKEGEEE